MPKKRVLLIESGKFIGGVISSLFSSNEGISLIEAMPKSAAELMEAMREQRPHIVVLDDTLNNEYLGQLLTYMQRSDGLRVVVVNTESNQIEVYQKQNLPVRHTGDLFAVL